MRCRSSCRASSGRDRVARGTLAVTGHITAGELVAFYGYCAFLMIPLRTATEDANKLIRGRVSGKRVCRVLALDAAPTDPASSGTPRREGPGRRPHRSAGRPARVTAVVGRPPDESAATADRLGICARPGPARSPRRRDTSDLTVRSYATPSSSAFRRPTLFSGRLLDDLDVPDAVARRPREGTRTASADDILEPLPDGLQTHVDERGRSFSGGRRQRLVLARALATDADVLVLVEPTSAVDAHTEARIADSLKDHRRGRTTSHHDR